jgi:hypothetical protein
MGFSLSKFLGKTSKAVQTYSPLINAGANAAGGSVPSIVGDARSLLSILTGSPPDSPRGTPSPQIILTGGGSASGMVPRSQLPSWFWPAVALAGGATLLFLASKGRKR